ncbi:hypothetical protein L798_06203 [Zootermopsis nevadensis]|uniref:Uncharacterized protein n=2 Tax=Zootermopsis nevadensis TaxID=136037 RepID=A0A067R7Q0_ZOONE|nr:hypothetical protein L798_06203 [Zootermopsis nevadensis]
MARERQRWFEVKPLCDSPEPPAGTSFISIALDDICPVLYLIAFGLVCSCVMLPFECIVHYCIKLYRQKYGRKQKPHYKWIARQKVMRMMYDTESQQQTTVWWISRAWQKFRHRLANAPFPFIH